MNGFAGGYHAKVPTITVHTFSAINTWELVKAKDTTVRGWFIKAKTDDQRITDFDYAFTSAPGDNYATSSGSGTAFDGKSLPDVYARTTDIGIVLELVSWTWAYGKSLFS